MKKLSRVVSFMLVTALGVGLTETERKSLGADREPASNPYVWKPKTKSVSVFKNGYGFFTREGEVALRDGWGHAAELPPATFGTLAIYAQNPQQLVDIVGIGEGEVTRFDGQEQKDDVDVKQHALESALATSVKLKYNDGKEELEATGVVKAISGGFVVLQQGNTATAIALSSIQSMQRATLPLRFHVLNEEGTPADKVALNMAYLRSGIVWIPEYTLKLIDEETAELTLRGTLANEAEDLIDCDVNFVVGVPHFVHSELLTPLAIGHTIRTLGTAMPGVGVPQQVMSQVMNRAAIGNNFNNILQNNDIGTGANTNEPNGAFASIMNHLPPSESVGSGDYSVYTKNHVTVRRGERAVVTLMTTRIRYHHTYMWNTGSDIEHRLSLSNSTTTPWTTGPCLALFGTQPLSEDMLKYTPVNGRGELTVTTAINIAKQIMESEVDRKLKSHEPQPNQFFDLVTVGGHLKIKSYERSPVQIRVRKTVLGKPIFASENGVLSVDSEKLRLLERSGTIEWNLTLDPGVDYDLEYRFERFVPSH